MMSRDVHGCKPENRSESSQLRGSNSSSSSHETNNSELDGEVPNPRRFRLFGSEYSQHAEEQGSRGIFGRFGFASDSPANNFHGHQERRTQSLVVDSIVDLKDHDSEGRKRNKKPSRSFSDSASVNSESSSSGKSMSSSRRGQKYGAALRNVVLRMSSAMPSGSQLVSVYFNGRILGDVSFDKPSPMVAEVRKILLEKFPNLSRSQFSFWYSKESSVPVEIEDEAITKISRCIADKVLCINSMEFMNDNLEGVELLISDEHIRGLTPEGENIVRHCLRLLENAVTNEKGQKSTFSLPKLAKSCLRFVKTIAQAIVDSRTTFENPGNPKVKWVDIERLLNILEEHLLLCNSRQDIAEWWFYRPDEKVLLDIIQQTQSSFRASPNLSPNHPLFLFKLPKLGPSAASLVDVLHKVKPIPFTGKKYDADRERLARYLGVGEEHLRNVILTKKERIFDSVDEAPLFRRRISGGKRGITADKIGSLQMKEILSPILDLQETFIDEYIREFCPGTREWALDAFDGWLHDPRSLNRSLIFMAPSGSGKTSIMCKLVRTRSRFVAAYHFCRHDDNRFRDGKAMLLSLIYQLSRRFPLFDSRVRAVLAEKKVSRKQLLGPNYSIQAIFGEMLASPISDIPVPPDEKVVILVDGIDEAKDGVEGGNEVLSVIQGMLHRLPYWILFCFTTKQKLAVLRKLRRFNARIISPTREQNESDFKHYFDAAYLRLKNMCLEDNELRRILAFNAGDSFFWCKLILLKVIECKFGCEIEQWAMVKVDEFLKAECTEICKERAKLFWGTAKLCMVAVRPLHIDILCDLLGCDRGCLLDVLSCSYSFFVVEGSVVRFVHKVSKDWVFNEIGNVDLASERRERRESFSGSSSRTLFVQNGAADEASICHGFFSRQVKRLMFSCNFATAEVTRPTQDYLLQHGVHHLALGKMLTEAKELILNPSWLLLHAADLDGIVQSCELLSDGDQVLALLARAVSLSGEASRKDPRQLIGQLVGRLLAVALDGHSDSSVRDRIVEFLNDLRSHDYGFQWWCPVGPTWDQAEQACLRTLVGHADAIQSAAWHSDGRRCASGSWDHDIKIWDSVTGLCIHTLSGHANTVWRVEWEPNGSRIASGSMDMSVRIWSVDTCSCERILLGHQDCVWDVRWSLDAKVIASASKDKTIRIWDPSHGACTNVLSGDIGLIYSISWEGGSTSRLCSGSTDNCVRVWNTETGECEAKFAGHTDWIRSVDWCKTGHYIVSASADRTVRVWDVETCECEHVLMGHLDTVWSVSTSHDGRYAVSGSSDGTIRVWDFVSGQLEAVLEGHKGAVWSVRFSPDSMRVVSGSTDKSLIIWDASIGLHKRAIPGHTQPIWCVDASKDGSIIVSGSADKTARLWNANSGLCEKVFSGHSGPVFAIKLAGNKKLLATGSSDNTAAIYRLKSGERKLQLVGHTSAVWCLAWSLDNSIVFTGSKDMTIRAWVAFTGKFLFHLNGHTHDVKGISVSLDGTRLASSSTDKTIRIWNLGMKSCESVLERQGAGGLCVEWHPVDRDLLVAGYTSGSVSVWNTVSRQKEIDFLPGHARRTNAVSWSPDGRRIVSVSSDKEIRIWNMKDHHCLKKITVSTGGIFGVVWTADSFISCGADKSIQIFNPQSMRCESVLVGDDQSSLGILDMALSKDGKLAVSGSRQLVVQIWNVETGICEKTLSGHTNWVHSVFFDNRGKQVLSRSDDGTARLWDVESGECLIVYEGESVTPEGFVAAPKPALRSLFQPAEKDQPVGVMCDKVRVGEDKACGWIGKNMYCFRLMGKPPGDEKPRVIEIGL